MRFKTFPIYAPLLIVSILAIGCASANSSNSPTVNVTSADGHTAQNDISTTQSPDLAPVSSEIPLPPPIGYVNDYANILNQTTRNNLERTLTELKQHSEIEFAVVTVDTTGEHSTFDYSLALARGWGIGPGDRSVGGGLLLLIAVTDRRWHIQVSRSLEGDLPNDVVAELGDRMRLPSQQGRPDEAVTTCVQAIIAHLAQRRGFSIDNVP